MARRDIALSMSMHQPMDKFPDFAPGERVHAVTIRTRCPEHHDLPGQILNQTTWVRAPVCAVSAPKATSNAAAAR
jgi:hypothetical protein